MPTSENTAGMEVRPLGEGLTKIILTGRFDTPGVDKIETVFLATTNQGHTNVIVDLSRVEFVASMAIRMFISVARSMRHRKTRLAMYGAQPMVSEVFENVALREIVPIVEGEAEAVAAVTSR